jgi:dihydroorotase
VEMVRFAKSRGLPVTSEVCPHHFTLCDSDVGAYDSNYKMKPPLRSCFDVAAVTEGLVNGAIEVIATDHAPHPGSEKMQEFERCPFGITGLETAIGLSLEQLVHAGRIPLMRMIEMYTVKPNAVLNLGKGTLAVGGVADVTVFDTGRKWTYDLNRSQSKSRNSPFHGRAFQGGQVATIVAGDIVWRVDA